MTNQAVLDLEREVDAIDPRSWSALPDVALEREARSLERLGRRIDAHRAAIAAELARRSDPVLGYDGLAARTGYRTAERHLAATAGISVGEAGRRIRAASLPPALAAVGAALSQGRIGLEQADAIVRPLSTSTAAPADLALAAGRLVEAAEGMDADALAREARDAGRALECVDPSEAEEALRRQRYLRLGRARGGMVPLNGLLDPESAVVVVGFFDAVTSPRRGGPRFVDPTAQERAERLRSDDRTDDQLRADALVALIRGRTAADDAALPPMPAPVRVLVPVEALKTSEGTASLEGSEEPVSAVPAGPGSRGTASFEGSDEPVSAATAQRILCDAGYLPIVFTPDRRVVDVGRTQRTFTAPQRAALAARDRGCRFPGCDRPPSWCEAHHITPWSHGGRTSLGNGILLCRHHHLLVHNNHWTIHQKGGAYEFRRPMRT